MWLWDARRGQALSLDAAPASYPTLHFLPDGRLAVVEHGRDDARVVGYAADGTRPEPLNPIAHEKRVSSDTAITGDRAVVEEILDRDTGAGRSIWRAAPRRPSSAAGTRPTARTSACATSRCAPCR